MKNEDIARALKNRLSGAKFTKSMAEHVMRQIKGEKKMKKKTSLAVVVALAVILTLTCGALAASMGVFGGFGMFGDGDDDLSRKMRKLSESSEAVLMERYLPPEIDNVDLSQAKTDYDKLLIHQQEKSFRMTLEESYCAGGKLYISYTLSSPETAVFRGAGSPSGIGDYDDYRSVQYKDVFAVCFAAGHQAAGYEEVWVGYDGETSGAANEWFKENPVGWYAYDSFSPEGSLTLADGTRLYAQELGDGWDEDGKTQRGFMSFELPENLTPRDTLTFTLNLLYDTTLICQDEDGVKLKVVRADDGRNTRMTFTVPMNNAGKSVRGKAQYSDYAAKAGLTLSEVELRGRVTIENCPEEWPEVFDLIYGGKPAADCVIDYLLVSDWRVYENANPGAYPSGEGGLYIDVEFNAPGDAKEMALRPVYSVSGPRASEDIPLSVQ